MFNDFFRRPEAPEETEDPKMSPRGKIAGLVVRAYGIGATDTAENDRSNAKDALREMGLDIDEFEHLEAKPLLGDILGLLQKQWDENNGEKHE